MGRKKYRPKRKLVEINVEQLDQIVEKACEAPLTRDEGELLKSSIHAMVERLRPRTRTTEKSEDLFARQNEGASDQAEQRQSSTTPADKKPRPGHGRNGVDKYPGAKFVAISHATLTHKCPCPGCLKGKLYDKKPKSILRIKAMPPIQATVYNLQELRCSLCGELYPADPPPGVGDEKYDYSVASMIGVLKYGLSMTFYRIQSLQQQLGVPLPSSVQFELVDAAAEKLEPVYQELRRLGAQGEVKYTDDTWVRILDEVEQPEDHDESRNGLHTTGTVSQVGTHLIAEFTSGPNHAGENLRDSLSMRADDLPPPIVMSDALSHNASKLSPELRQALANCLTHGRRKFVDILEAFPEPCRYVIDQIGAIYENDAEARESGVDGSARLHLHQAKSGPVMDNLKTWMEAQMNGLVEPNSGLGKAINYFLKRWDRLTLFLRLEGAPLDTNIVERALKKAVLHRKNALFFKTQNGAHVGDVFMSIIHTCELNKVNPFLYLTDVQKHAQEVAEDPAAWLPWNYQLQLGRSPTCESPAQSNV